MKGAQQGNSEGWVTAAEGIIALDADHFVVGHGDIQTKGDLQKRTIEAEVEREKIKELVVKGVTLQQIQSLVGDPPPGQSKPGPRGHCFTPFSEVVYQELTEKGVFAAAIARIAGPQKVTFEVLAGVDHHGDPGFETEKNVQRILSFLDQCLLSKWPGC